MARLSILVVDDYVEIRTLMRIWLESFDHRVVCASGGKEAMRLLKKDRYDLVITDVLMPGCSGAELIAMIRKLRSRIRIIAISGGGSRLASSTCLQLAHETGAHALLMKPFRSEQLQTAIRHVRQADPAPLFCGDVLPDGLCDSDCAALALSAP
jgi:CheY-like chemotaxis protein